MAHPSEQENPQPRRSSPISRPLVIVAAVVAVLLAGAITLLVTRDSSHRTAQPNASQTPNLNGLITKVPAIYPVVQAQLADQKPLHSLLPYDDTDCTDAGYSTLLPGLQWCSWAPAAMGKTQDEILSVSIAALSSVSKAHTDLMSAGKASMGYFAPTVIERSSVPGLGDEALVGRTEHGLGAARTAVIDMSGAEISVRIRNVVIAVVWEGANYTLNSSGTTASSVTGFPYAQSRAEAIAIARAVASHI